MRVVHGAYNDLFVEVAAVSVSTRWAMRDSFWMVGKPYPAGLRKGCPSLAKSANQRSARPITARK